MAFNRSKSSVSNQTTTNEAGFSEISGTAQQVNLERINIEGGDINLTDQGAISASFGFANNALESSNARVSTALSAVGQTTSEAISAVQAAANADTSKVMVSAMKWGSLVVIGFFVAKYFKR